jgi:ComF family protein
MKFRHRADLADRLTVLLPEAAIGSLAGRLIVPVPLHYSRLVERGFNAAALLSRQLGRRSGARYAPTLLTRSRDTPHQSRLPAAARRENVRDAFVAREGAAGRQAVLVDDVITTGSTLDACCRALYAAGVVHVTVVALAATPTP